ncbi:MAG: Crp/Fnr family transcriptional regulator [Minwuia sp.]|nr:Crp/Fnr family transcriptional regulator [Minwuia sp.]
MHFVEKLGRFTELSDDERIALATCVETEKVVPAQTRLVNQGDEYPSAYVIERGWSFRQRLLKDGRRQVMNFLVPGDAIGFAAAFFAHADHTVITMTEVRYARIDPDRLMQVIAGSPRLGATLFWSTALEESVLREHIVSLGQRTAREHMAHLLVELAERVRKGGMPEAEAQLLPVTQILLADVLGISPVHTNRTIRQLVREGVIETSARGIALLDEPRLRQMSDFDEQFLHEDGGPDF